MEPIPLATTILLRNETTTTPEPPCKNVHYPLDVREIFSLFPLKFMVENIPALYDTFSYPGSQNKRKKFRGGEENRLKDTD